MAVEAKREQEVITRRRFIQAVASAGLGGVAQAGAAAAPRTADESHQPLASGRPRETHVYLNQVGFLPGDPKWAVIPTTAPLAIGTFAVVDDAVTPQIRYRGHLTRYAGAIHLRHRFAAYYHADFTPFVRPGRYRLRLADGHLSQPFSIGHDVYNDLVPLILRYYDTQKCGPSSSEAHGPCHLDDGIAVGGPHDGQVIDAAGGWHDAGDYLKFVETTSFVTALMLSGYDHLLQLFPRRVPRPHSRKLPPFLAHAKVGLDWLLKMHPSPEEFYYQVGDETDHDSWRLPERDCARYNQAWKPRPVLFGVGANLAGRTAVAFAVAARLYRRYDRALAQRCLAKAQSVYRLGLKNRQVVTTRPRDFYPETSWADDMEWAAAQLYQTTRQPEYLHHALAFSKQLSSDAKELSVYHVDALAHLALYPFAPPRDQERLLGYLRRDAEAIRQRATGPYCLGTSYTWGTAEAAAGAALTCRIYGMLTRDRSYLNLARRQRDWVLGCNPFGLSCVIGTGSRYALFPHHQIANLKGIELTGAVIGGPAPLEIFAREKISLDEKEFDSQRVGPVVETDEKNQAIVYHDAVQDYVCNEAANDYTAKMLLVAAFDMLWSELKATEFR